MMMMKISDKDNESNWKREWSRERILNNRSSSNGGVGILFSRSFIPCSFEVEEIIEGRLVKVKTGRTCKIYTERTR